MKNIAVFCGSSTGDSVVYQNIAQQLAFYFASNDLTIIYGGGKVGLMGIIADVALAEGGKVIGVIPRHLEEQEVAHAGLTVLYVVDSMHQRIKLIEELSDGFIALPGGLGTTEEIFEMLTWAQLNLHKKPCAFVNVNGYFNHLMDFLDQMVQEGFLDQGSREMIIMEPDISAVFEKLHQYEHPAIDKAQNALRK